MLTTKKNSLTHTFFCVTFYRSTRQSSTCVCVCAAPKTIIKLKHLVKMNGILPKFEQSGRGRELSFQRKQVEKQRIRPLFSVVYLNKTKLSTQLDGVVIFFDLIFERKWGWGKNDRKRNLASL